MKRIAFLLLIVVLVACSVYAKKIEKIAPNNVEVTPTKKVVGLNGIRVEVYDESKKKHYGKRAITELKAKYSKELSDAKNLNARKYKKDLIAKRQADVNKIEAIKTILPSKTVTDINGNEIQVFDSGGSDAYEELIEESSAYQRLLTEAQNLDENKYKKDLINKAQENYDEILLIEAEMGKE